MSMYKQFQADPDREKNGILVEYGTFRVTVARAGGGNKSFGKALEHKTRPFRRAMATGVMDNEKGLDILREVYAEQVVRNWEVLVDPDGNPVSPEEAGTREDLTWKQGIEAPDGSIHPFSAENVKKTFKALPDLFLDIKEQAESMQLFRTGLREELGEG